MNAKKKKKNWVENIKEIFILIEKLIQTKFVFICPMRLINLRSISLADNITS